MGTKRTNLNYIQGERKLAGSKMCRLWSRSALSLCRPGPSSASPPGTQGQALVWDPPEHINRKLCLVCSNVTRKMLLGVWCWGQSGKNQRVIRGIC